MLTTLIPVIITALRIEIITCGFPLFNKAVTTMQSEGVVILTSEKHASRPQISSYEIIFQKEEIFGGQQ